MRVQCKDHVNQSCNRHEHSLFGKVNLLPIENFDPRSILFFSYSYLLGAGTSSTKSKEFEIEFQKIFLKQNLV